MLDFNHQNTRRADCDQVNLARLIILPGDEVEIGEENPFTTQHRLTSFDSPSFALVCCWTAGYVSGWHGNLAYSNTKQSYRQAAIFSAIVAKIAPVVVFIRTFFESCAVCTIFHTHFTCG